MSLRDDLSSGKNPETICPDSLLHQLSRHCPITFLNIKEIMGSKADMYGSKFLECIINFIKMEGNLSHLLAVTKPPLNPPKFGSSSYQQRQSFPSSKPKPKASSKLSVSR